MRGSARAHLQAATADIHQALHGVPPFARIASGTMDRESYAGLLQFLHRYHDAMAASCTAAAVRLGAPELAAAHRDRMAALHRDLAFFAKTPDSGAGVADADADFAVGCLYTVQGSTLGGKLIHRQLQALLPDGRGRAFFAGHDGDSANWRLFCEKLEDDETLDLARVEAGARHAFLLFDRMLHEAGLAAEPV